MNRRFLHKFSWISTTRGLLANRRRLVGQIRTARRNLEFEQRRHIILDSDEESETKQADESLVGVDDIISNMSAQLEMAGNSKWSEEQQLNAKRKICHLVCDMKQSNDFDAALGLGILAQLRDYVTMQALQFDTVRAVHKICDVGASQVDQVMASGLVAQLLELLFVTDDNVLYEAHSALGSILKLGTPYCQQLIDQGFLTKFTASFKADMDVKMKSLISFNLATLTRSRYENWQQQSIDCVLPFVKKLLQANDNSNDHIDYYCLNSLVYLTSGENIDGIIAGIVENGLLEITITHLSKDEVEMVTWAAVQVIENIVLVSDDSVVRHVINLNALLALSKLLQRKPCLAMQHSGLRALASLCASNPEHIPAVFQADLFPVIILYIETYRGEEQILAGWALSNILLSGCDELIHDTLTTDVLSTITLLLPLPCQKLVYNLLRGVEHALGLFNDDPPHLIDMAESSGIYSQLGLMQEIENTEIAEIAARIFDTVNRYFLAEDMKIKSKYDVPNSQLA